jgi:hypothetical protein
MRRERSNAGIVVYVCICIKYDHERFGQRRGAVVNGSRIYWGTAHYLRNKGTEFSED